MTTMPQQATLGTAENPMEESTPNDQTSITNFYYFLGNSQHNYRFLIFYAYLPCFFLNAL